MRNLILLLAGLLLAGPVEARYRTSVDVSIGIGVHIGRPGWFWQEFQHGFCRSIGPGLGPKVFWHNFNGGTEPITSSITMNSRHSSTKFTIVPRCNASSIVILDEDGNLVGEVKGRGYNFSLPNMNNDFDQTYHLFILARGDPHPWHQEIIIESSPAPMRSSYP